MQRPPFRPPLRSICLTTAFSAEPAPDFRSLALRPSLLEALDRVNYTRPTPIQAALIPHAIAGRDVIGQAQTGTGKTAAFLLPFFEQWRENEAPGPHAIVMCPTRELAVQVREEAAKLTPDRGFKSIAVYGGTRMGKQV